MAAMRKAHQSKAAGRRRSVLSRIALVLVAAAIFFYAFVTLSLLLFRRVNPLTTAVQVERRLESLLHRKPYRKVYAFVDSADFPGLATCGRRCGGCPLFPASRI
jgi:hypothetical protein